MGNLQAVRVGRACAVAASMTTLSAIALTVALAAPQRWPLVVVLVMALVWGLGGSFAVAMIPSSGDKAESDKAAADKVGADQAAGDEAGSDETARESADELRIGTLMNLGRVPDQVARMTSAIAAASGPVIMVVPPDREIPVGLDPAVVVVQSQRPNVSNSMTEFYTRCDAVLVTSARAMPAPGHSEAGGLIAQGASWVQGVAEPLNQDRFGPASREVLDSRLRRRATATGLWLWEPDATIISTALLRKHPLPVGRPLGSWLRKRSSEGSAGAVVDTTLTRRAAPVAAEGFWPDTTARQCAAAADLSDAARSGSSSIRSRAVAAGLLVRALSGWSVLWWLAALVLLTDGSPVRQRSGLLAVLVAVSVVLRWLAPRLATGVSPSPLTDLVAGLYGLPGSLAAVFSAVTRRVRPQRRAVSTRPLVWLGLVATAAAANVVLTAKPGVGAARLAAGAAAGLLVLTWVFTVRSLVERRWRRVGFRVPLDLPAHIGADPAPGTNAQWRLVDGGSGGCAIDGPATGLSQGDELTVQIHRPERELVTLHGTVASVRHNELDMNRHLLGVEINTVVPGSASWAQLLTESACHNSTTGQVSAQAAPVDERIQPTSWGQRIDRLAIGLVIVVSLAVVLTLGLVLVGLRPLVIRSGSMVPTYGVGDVVLVASERADSIREGQVVTRFDAPEANDSLTHRVQKVSISEGQVRVLTKGDANETSEDWSVPATQHVGVVVASVPAIGLPLTMIRSSTGWAVIVAALVLAVIGMLFRPRRRPPGRNTFRDGSLMPTDQVPNTTSMSTIGEKK